MLNITVLPQEKCRTADLDLFRQMIILGGEVSPYSLPHLIKKALALSFARLDNKLVGVGAIKRPYDSHRFNEFKKAKSSLNPSKFEFELGWFYIDPSSRGNRIASKLIMTLMPTLNGRVIYSASRTDNTRMHSSLQRVGFVREGAPYPSTINDQNIQLFICKHDPNLPIKTPA